MSTVFGLTFVIISLLIPIINGMITNSTSNSLWVLLNQYQLYLMLPLLNTYLPYDFVYFIRELQFVLLDFKLEDIALLSLIYETSDGLDYEQPVSVLRDNGIESGSFFINQLDNVIIFSTFIMMNVIFILLYLALSACLKMSDKQVTKRCSKFFHFTVYIRHIIEAYLYAMLSCLSELYHVDLAKHHPWSYTISAVFFVTFVLFVLLIFLHVKFSNKPSESKYFKELYNDFKPSTWAQLFYACFLIRRTLITIAIVMINWVPSGVKLTFYTIIQVGYVIYFIKVRPFDSWSDNLIELINDFIYILS